MGLERLLRGRRCCGAGGGGGQGCRWEQAGGCRGWDWKVKGILVRGMAVSSKDVE